MERQQRLKSKVEKKKIEHSFFFVAFHPYKWVQLEYQKGGEGEFNVRVG